MLAIYLNLLYNIKNTKTLKKRYEFFKILYGEPTMKASIKKYIEYLLSYHNLKISLHGAVWIILISISCTHRMQTIIKNIRLAALTRSRES